MLHYNTVNSLFQWIQQYQFALTKIWNHCLIKRQNEQAALKSELVREALRRQLSIESFRQIRNRILPFAETQGLLTDEDVWREIS